MDFVARLAVTWFFLSLVVVALALLLRRAMKGPAFTVESLVGPISGLLRQGYNGGFLIISVERSKKFLQLNKYITGPGQFGLELAFPRAPWAAEYYDSFQLWCKARNVPYRKAPSGEHDPSEFIIVDLGTDIRSAHAFVSDVLREILNAGSSRLFCRLENATVEDRLIDS